MIKDVLGNWIQDTDSLKGWLEIILSNYIHQNLMTNVILAAGNFPLIIIQIGIGSIM